MTKETGGSRLLKKESTKKLKDHDNSQALVQKKTGDLHNPFKKLVQDYDNLVSGVTQIMTTQSSADQDDNDKLKKCVVVSLVNILRCYRLVGIMSSLIFCSSSLAKS